MTKILHITAAGTIVYALRSDGQVFAGEIGDSKWIQMAPIPQVDAPEETESDPMIFLPDGQSVRAAVVAVIQRRLGGYPLADGTLQLPYVQITCKGTEQQPGAILHVDCETWDDTLLLTETINAQLGKRRGES